MFGAVPVSYTHLRSRMKTMIDAGKRLLACLLIPFTFLFLSSCSYLDYFSLKPTESTENPAGEGDNPGTDSPNKQFTLALFTGETLNPYTSVNRANVNIVRLCYDGLISLTDSGETVPLIAEYEMNGTQITFKIKNESYFSDGNKITAADCVYSYNCASQEGSVYQSVFSNYIQSWKALTEDTFQVTLKKNNNYNINLFNIPIIKRNTNTADYPVGSGRYKISYNEKEMCIRDRCSMLFRCLMLEWTLPSESKPIK